MKNTTQSLATATPQLIAIELIDPSPLNPRKHFSDEKLAALSESLRSRGQMEAGIVRPSPGAPGRYELANGERRWRACRAAGIATFVAKVVELSDAEMVELALTVGMGDNVESLTAVEEAEGYRRLMDIRKMNQMELAAHIGRSEMHVVRRISLLHLPKRARAAVESGELALRTAHYLAAIPGEEKRAEACEAVMHSELHGGVMPQGAALAYIRDHVCRALRATPFDQRDADLLPEAGACTNCPHRAGNNPECYGDMVGRSEQSRIDRCMHPGCFDKKVSAHRIRLMAKHAVGGKLALGESDNARVFPRDESGIHYASEFVDYNQRPTPDLLKKEVAPGSVPLWRELLDGVAVQVWVGVDQAGKVVELVRRDEALAALPAAERAVFAVSEMRRATGASPSSPRDGVEEERSRAAEEKQERAEREKAERARRKKAREACAWLETLGAAVVEGWAGGGLPLWSLMYELHEAQLGSEELAAVAELVDRDGDAEQSPAQRLRRHVAGCGLPQLAALCVQMQVAPRVLAEGADGPTARAWHAAVVAGSLEGGK